MKNKRPSPPFLGGYRPDELYETTFADWQRHNDRIVWQGAGDTAEFPHNPGAREEQIDEALGVSYTEEEDGRYEFGTYGKGKRY